MKNVIVLLTLVFGLIGCSKDDGNDFGFLNPKGTCELNNQYPTEAQVKLSAVSTENIFSVNPAKESCNVTWTLNGETISQKVLIKLDAAEFQAGSNTLVASTPDAKKTWTVIKNSLPVCSSITPGTAQIISYPQTVNMTTVVSDADGDALQLAWTVNNASSSNISSTAFISGTASATFTPQSNETGFNTINLKVSDGTDTKTCSWQVSVVDGICSISSSSPTSASLKVSAVSTNSTGFGVTLSRAACPVEWKLNGTAISTTNFVNLLSSSMVTGANTLTASTVGTNGTDTKTWTVIKNAPPTCGTMSPSTTGVNVNATVSTNMSLAVGNSDSDSLTVSWLNGGNTSATLGSLVLSGNNASAVFTPTSANIGSNLITARVTDGYDSVDCSWQIAVNDGTCSILTSAPSSSTFKVAAASSTTTGFSVNLSRAACTVDWKLNGTSISSANVLSLQSSSLASGANTLTASTVGTNGTDTKTWTVTKNYAPVCGTMTPNSAASSQNATQSETMSLAVLNADSDALTVSWLNGGNSSATLGSIALSGNNASAVFTPTTSNLGLNVITARVSDGLDTAECSWQVTVNDGSCTISTSTPASSSLKVSALGTTSTGFGVTASRSACAIDWKLNGSSIGSGNFLSVLSSSLTAGSNTLTASTVGTNGTDTKTWSVTKNVPSTCGAMTPNTSGISLMYNQTSNLNLTVGNSDSDTLQVAWLNGGNTSSTLGSIGLSGNVATATFSPTFSNVGLNTLTARVSDGYDTTDCSWNLTVKDPNALQIVSCSPNVVANQSSTLTPNAVLTSTGTNSTKDFIVSATGTNLTYSWKKDGVTISGQSTPQVTLSSSTLSAGSYVYRVDVVDQYSNSGFCEWRVKRNTPPVISAVLPNIAEYYVNYNSAPTFSTTVTDADGDPVTYKWTLDNALDATLGNGGPTALFTPSIIQLGLHTIVVEATDTYETAKNTWTVRVNGYSSSCNSVFNSTNPGFGCTIAGDYRTGVGYDQAATPNVQKIRPKDLVEDKNTGYNGYYLMSEYPFGLYYWNLKTSSVTRNGITIGAGKMERIAGKFAQGQANDTGDSTTNGGFKLGDSWAIALDGETGDVYVAAYALHKIYKISSTGAMTRFLGTGANTNNTASNTDGQAGTAAVCASPSGLKIKTVGLVRYLFAACYSSSTIKKIGIDTTDSTNYNKTYIVVGGLTSGASSVGQAEGTLGATGTARASGPWDLDVDSNGLVYWTDRNGQNKLRVANTTGSPKYFFNNAITVAGNNTATLLGTTTDSLNVNTTTRTRAYSTVTLSDPRGVSVVESGNNVVGFFVVNYGLGAVVYVNNTNIGTTLGGTTIAGNEVGYLFGGAGITDGSAQSARIGNNTSKVKTLGDSSALLIADYVNGRVRSFTLTSSGTVTTLLGNGNFRHANLSTDLDTTPNSSMFNFPYGLKIDRTANVLYLADQNNGRIKSMDLNSGFMGTLVGRGTGAGASANDQDPATTLLGYPRNINFVPGSIHQLLVWTEVWTSSSVLTTGASGANRSCVVRAYNPSPSTQTILGTSIVGGGVSVIAGNYVNGCGAYTGEGGYATNATLQNPEAFDLDSSGNMYLVSSTGHCIHKIDTNGTISTFAGTCGTPEASGAPNDSSGTTAPLFRYPSSIVADPKHPNNFLVTDQYDGSGALRYINTGGAVTFRGVNIPAAPNGGIMVKTILIEPSSGGRINATAIYYKAATNTYWICISAGQTSDGNVGSHSVSCFDRNSLASYQINATSLKGKSPEDASEENVAADTNMSLFTPQGIDFDANGNLFIVERSGSLIRMVKKWF